MQKVVDIRNARTSQYRSVIQEIAEDGKCPFCPNNFRYHTRRILKRYKGWFITRNFNPYPGTRHHFLLIGSRHIVKTSLLTSNDMIAIGHLVSWAEKHFNIQGGALAMRFGNTRYTGATVSHIHCHLIVPMLEYRKSGSKRQRLAKVVSFPIG